MRIEVATDDQALANLHDAWASLLSRTPAASGFQSLAWIQVCRAALPTAASLWTLVVRDASEVMAIVPAELERGRLRLIGEGVSNYLGPLYDPERLDRIVPALAQFLAAERGIDLIDFRGLRETSPFLAALAGADLPHWSRSLVVRTATAPYADLRPGWDALYARRKGSFRGNVARKWKGLARLGRVEFNEATDPAAVRAALDAMFRLFRGRWTGRHESGGFADGRRAFHAQAAPVLATSGHLSLAMLTLDDELVAFHYGLRAGSITSSYVLAHEDALNVCSPGQLLLVRTLEAASRRGDCEYDFGIGEEQYKETWASGSRGVFRLLRWRRHRLAGVNGRLRGLGTQLWVAARSIDALRRARREGIFRSRRAPATPPDEPGLAAGPEGTWHVYRLDGIAGAPGTVSTESWPYATMRQCLSPRLLDLAVDRAFRGDVLLALVRAERPVGIVWRASDGRRSLVAARSVQADAPVYYHPVPADGENLDEVVRTLAMIGRDAPEALVVTGAPLADASIPPLSRFTADHRFASPLGPDARAVQPTP